LLMSALGTDDGETLRLSQLDQMLQMILVNNGLLDDMDSRIFTPASSQQRDAFTTLRDLRRSGPFGNVSEGGQAALLGGALYEYSNAVPPVPRSEARQRSLMSTQGSFTADDNSVRAVAEVRAGLGRILNESCLSSEPSRSELGESFMDGSILSRPVSPSTLSSFQYAGAIGSRGGVETDDSPVTIRVPNSGGSLEFRDTSETLGLQDTGRSLGLRDSAGSLGLRDSAGSLGLRDTGGSFGMNTTVGLAVTNAADGAIESLGGSFDADSLSASLRSNNALVSILGGSRGYARMPASLPQHVNSSASDGGESETTALWLGGEGEANHSGTSMLSDTNDNSFLPGDIDRMYSELAAMLRRLAAFDASALDESLARSVRRVLQMGTALTGARLTDEEIRALPKVRFERAEEQQCAICLETFQSGELLTQLPCAHFYHVECITRWFHDSVQCPLCRTDCGPLETSRAQD